MKNKEMILCTCGCGQSRNKFDKRGRERKYINFHGWKGKKHSEKTKKLLREQRLGKKYPKASETRKRLIKESKVKVFGHGISPITRGMLGKKNSHEIKKLDKNFIKKQYLLGYSCDDIGKKLGVCNATITNRLVKMGVKIRHNYRSEITKKKISKMERGKNFREKIRKKLLGRYIGEKNPNWQGGISFEPYDKLFNNKFKRAIRKRDNYICLKCGKHQEKEKRTLSIHHINYDKKLTIPQNCCAVCRGCNSEVNFNREHWTKFFQSLLSEKYGYQYSKEEEVIINIKNV